MTSKQESGKTYLTPLQALKRCTGLLNRGTRGSTVAGD